MTAHPSSETDAPSAPASSQQCRCPGGLPPRDEPLWDLLPDAVFLLIPQADHSPPIVFDCNAAACHQTGYARDELLGQRITLFDPFPFWPAERASVDTQLREQTSVLLNRVFQHRDGSRYPSEVHASRRSVDNQEVIVVVARSKPHTVVEAPAARQHLLEAAAESFLLVGLLTPDGVLLEANRTAISFVGTAAEHVVGRPLWELSWWETCQESQAWLHNAIEQGAAGTTSRANMPLRAADGAVHTVDFMLWPVYDPGGLLMYLVWAAYDITAHSRTEHELRASEARLHAVLEHMPILLDALDADGNILFWNRECVRVTGYEGDELIGNRRFAELLYPDTGARRELGTAWRARGNDFRDWELELTTREGAHRTIAWSSVADHSPIPGWATWAVGVDVTERRQAEIALQESETLLRQLADHLSDMLWVVDADWTTILFLSSAFTALTGYPHERLATDIEFWLGVVVHPDDQVRVRAEATSRTGLERGIEYRIVRANHQVRWVQSRAFPILEANNQIRRCAGITIDITERRAAEEALRVSEERLRLLADSVPALVWMMDQSGATTFYNRRWTHYTGIPAGDLSRAAIGQLVHPEDHDATVALIDLHLAACEPFTCEWRLRTADGTYRWLLEKAVPQFADDGSCRGFFGACLDITERKRVEATLYDLNLQLEQRIRDRTEALHHANQELHRSSLRLRSITESLDEGLALLDQHQTVLMANRALAHLYALPPTELLGQAWHTICRPTATLVAQTLADGLPAQTRFHLRRTGDDRSVVDARTFAVVSDAGAVEHVVLHLADVTDRLHLEELALRNERQAESGRLAAIVAHEVNTPLQAIQNFLFLANSDDPRERATYLTLAADETERTASLVRRLLHLQHPSDGVLLPIDANALIERVVTLAAGVFQRHHVALVLDIAPHIPPFLGRHDELMQVLLNLAMNAIDAMPRGGQLSIRAHAQPVARYTQIMTARHPVVCVIEISDTGTGITDEVLPFIFEPFFTTKPHGSGLGLSISRRIVEQHGGQLLTIETSPTGSRFAIVLPTSEPNLNEPDLQ